MVYTPPCYQQAYLQCPDDEYPWHLYAKQAILQFYGWSEDWHNWLAGEARDHHHEEYGHWKWETCMLTNYEKHLVKKIRAGFQPSMNENLEEENLGKE